MAHLLNETRQAVLSAEFARAESLLAELPGWLASQPEAERRSAAESALGELRQWLQLTSIHRSHLALQVARFQTADRFRQEPVGDRHSSPARCWQG